MPETAVNEDHGAASRKNYIRFARKVLAVKPESVAKGMS